MAYYGMNIIMGLMLLSCGVQDAWKKKISLRVVIAAVVGMGICIPFCTNESIVSISERFGGIAIGVVVIIISLGTHGKIGIGDGLLLCATGLGLGFWGNLELFAIALLTAAILSIVLLALRLADRKKAIPFVPFLLLGYLIIMIAQYGAGV